MLKICKNTQKTTVSTTVLKDSCKSGEDKIQPLQRKLYLWLDGREDNSKNKDLETRHVQGEKMVCESKKWYG